jgi:hypothetical protein
MDVDLKVNPKGLSSMSKGLLISRFTTKERILAFKKLLHVGHLGICIRLFSIISCWIIEAVSTVSNGMQIVVNLTSWYRVFTAIDIG